MTLANRVLQKLQTIFTIFLFKARDFQGLCFLGDGSWIMIFLHVQQHFTHLFNLSNSHSFSRKCDENRGHRLDPETKLIRLITSGEFFTVVDNLRGGQRSGCPEILRMGIKSVYEKSGIWPRTMRIANGI